uniref:Uncharacterized protein n=1 Tax=Prevotella sp. GTC17262 TaxID=3236797 RepID=A0AB33JP56_9BACT
MNLQCKDRHNKTTAQEGTPRGNSYQKVGIKQTGSSRQLHLTYINLVTNIYYPGNHYFCIYDNN